MRLSLIAKTRGENCDQVLYDHSQCCLEIQFAMRVKLLRVLLSNQRKVPLRGLVHEYKLRRREAASRSKRLRLHGMLYWAMESDHRAVDLFRIITFLLFSDTFQFPFYISWGENYIGLCKILTMWQVSEMGTLNLYIFYDFALSYN